MRAALSHKRLVSSRLRLRVVSKKNRRFLFVETLGVEGLRLRLRLVPPLPILFHSISVFIDDCHGSNGRLLGLGRMTDG